MRLLTIVAVALLAGAPAARADVGHLVGTVGPGFTIDLTDTGGNHVGVVTAGTYEFVIHDLSDVHDFVLGEQATGIRPISTTIPFVGDQTFTVTLRPGGWVYACSAHFQTMFGRLTVVPATLRATLAAGGRVTLSSATANAGTYTITAVDRSKKLALSLTGPGVSRTTGKRFTGIATWTVTLRAGVYRFGRAALTVS